MTKAMPEAWLRVLGHRPARALLLSLGDEARGRKRYSEVRRALDMHPQTFSDALRDLLNAGLVFSQEPVEGNRHVVYLEATHLGKFLVAHWIEEQERFAQRARKDPLVRAALRQVEAEA